MEHKIVYVQTENVFFFFKYLLLFLFFVYAADILKCITDIKAKTIIFENELGGSSITLDAVNKTLFPLCQ